MESVGNLLKQSNGLSVREKTSLLDLTLARLLDKVSQVYGIEILPGQAREFKECLKSENPEMVEAGFLECFKEREFPPKPSSVVAGIKRIRERMAEEVATREYVPIDREATAREQARPEWEQSSQELRRQVKTIAETATPFEKPRNRPYIPTTVELAAELQRTAELRQPAKCSTKPRSTKRSAAAK